MLAVLESRIEKVPRVIRGESREFEETGINIIGAQERALLLNLRALEFDDRALQMN